MNSLIELLFTPLQAQEKDRKEIKHLQMKEAQRDAAELQEDTEEGAEESIHFFRKVSKKQLKVDTMCHSHNSS